jgi:hypothetical protein
MRTLTGGIGATGAVAVFLADAVIDELVDRFVELARGFVQLAADLAELAAGVGGVHAGAIFGPSRDLALERGLCFGHLARGLFKLGGGAGELCGGGRLLTGVFFLVVVLRDRLRSRGERERGRDGSNQDAAESGGAGE